MTADELRETARRLCTESRAAQGLPEHVTDSAALARLAALFTTSAAVPTVPLAG